MKANAALISGIGAILLGGALSLSASTVTYDFGQISGGTPPVGSPPWLEAVFTDTGLPANTVQLTVSAGNLTGSEFVSCMYFNLNPSLKPTALSFSMSGSSGSFMDPAIATGANAFKAGPDGKYDILLGFSTANAGRFTSGDSITFTITDASGLTASDFDQLSVPASGSGPYASAAHVQAIGPDDGSAWINPSSTVLTPNESAPAVPDSSATVFLLGASLLAIDGLRRKLHAHPFSL